MATIFLARLIDRDERAKYTNGSGWRRLEYNTRIDLKVTCGIRRN